RELSLAFGPSGCEDAVRDIIIEQIQGDCDAYTVDKAGNLIAVIRGRGLDYNRENPRRLMLSAHMDEVGFMIQEITEEGYLRFGTVGGIDPRVLCGRHVVVGEGKRRVHGVIASKAIHLQTAEERTKATPVRKMYIDIGARDREDAKKYVSVGDYATFDSDFVTFGKDGCMMKGKALDDRAGCAMLIEIMRDLHRDPCNMPFDVCFAFTCCEEVGISGANVAAFGIKPDTAIILEATAVNDLPGAGRNAVSKQGEGGTLTLADRGTIYDMGFINFARQTAEQKGLKCQIKQTVTGGTDAAHIQRALTGVRVLGLSLPTRYIHSASNVARYEDFEETRKLVSAMIREWKLN
ncbi:MAG: M20/M25/M40 family metallo-hydrolase, partial [Clostridia bacterium]|nr:M20/M25/M40 family metallo-hydrolase [Clostridia bacterium]